MFLTTLLSVGANLLGGKADKESQDAALARELAKSSDIDGGSDKTTMLIVGIVLIGVFVTLFFLLKRS